MEEHSLPFLLVFGTHEAIG